MTKGNEPAFPTGRTSGAPLADALEGLTRREYFAAMAPIPFEMVKRIWGSNDVDLNSDKNRAAFLAIWAMVRIEYADALLLELQKGEAK